MHTEKGKKREKKHVRYILYHITTIVPTHIHVLYIIHTHTHIRKANDFKHSRAIQSTNFFYTPFVYIHQFACKIHETTKYLNFIFTISVIYKHHFFLCILFSLIHAMCVQMLFSLFISIVARVKSSAECEKKV